MDIVRLREIVLEGSVKAAEVVELTRIAKLAPDAVFGYVVLPITEMRAAIRPMLEEMESNLDRSAVVVHWNRTNLEESEASLKRYRELSIYLLKLVEIADSMRLTNPIESKTSVRVFNERIKEMFSEAIALRQYNEAEYNLKNPVTYTGLGDIHIAEPAYVAPIRKTLDEILARISRPSVAGPASPTGDELLTLVREIAAWVRAQQGTGKPPVVVTEGIVGEFVEYKPWHSTAGTGGIMYGNPGQPKLLLGNWQYDALYRCAQTGSFLTVAVPGGVAKHITLLGDKTFWVSISTGEIPKAPIPVVLSDLDTAGNRVIQRLNV